MKIWLSTDPEPVTFSTCVINKSDMNNSLRSPPQNTTGLAFSHEGYTATLLRISLSTIATWSFPTSV
jgi:hypothetical protein